MADKMEFPKTIKEFIDGYSFKDSDEVYTNGVELITVFRVEQALEHYLPEVRAKAFDEFVEVVKNTYHNFCGYDLERMTKYGNENTSQQEQSYSTLMMYEIAGEFDDMIDALDQLKSYHIREVTEKAGEEGGK